MRGRGAIGNMQGLFATTQMAAGEVLEGKDGEFWANTKPGKHTFEREKVSAEASDDSKASKLWSLSAKATGLKAGDSPFYS